MYKYYNANAIGNDTSDCVVRAIARAEGISWDEAYEKLSDIAQSKGLLLDDVNFVEDYLDERYYRVQHYSKTVGEFTEEYPIGTYILTMQGHVTVIEDGTVFDTFDTRPRRMWAAWEIDNY